MEIDQPDDSIPIIRTVRIEALEASRYIEPPHTIISTMDPAWGITPQDIITTAICWLVGRRPSDVSVYQPTKNPDQIAEYERAKQNPLSDQLLAFMGMSGLMTLAKEVRNKSPRINTDYLKLRWKALCATSNLVDMWEKKTVPEVAFLSTIDNLIAWQAWIKPHVSMRRKLLNYALSNTETNALVKGSLDQVKMVLQDFGLKSALLMESFVTTGSRAIFLPAIAQQAYQLKRALTELRALHKERFPYLRVYPLEGVERIQHRLYPDLYYAAINLAVKNKELGPEGQYAITAVQTTIPKRLIDKQMELRYKVRPALDEDTKRYLIELGVDPSAALRRGREEEEDFYEERAPRRQRLQQD